MHSCIPTLHAPIQLFVLCILIYFYKHAWVLSFECRAAAKSPSQNLNRREAISCQNVSALTINTLALTRRTVFCRYLLYSLWTWPVQATVHSLWPRANQFKTKQWLWSEWDPYWPLQRDDFFFFFFPCQHVQTLICSTICSGKEDILLCLSAFGIKDNSWYITIFILWVIFAWVSVNIFTVFLYFLELK